MPAFPPLSTLTRPLPKVLERLGVKPTVLPPVVSKQLPWLIEPLVVISPLRRVMSRIAIKLNSYATQLRPRPLSMASDYTTWPSLTDRSFTGRHLPPADPAATMASGRSRLWAWVTGMGRGPGRLAPASGSWIFRYPAANSVTSRS